MSERNICQRCDIEIRRSEGIDVRRSSFLISGAEPHYAPDRPFRLEHILLDVEVNPEKKTLKGVVTQKLTVVASGQRWIRLDQVGLTVHEVFVGENAHDHKALHFVVEGETLRIQLKRETEPACTPGESITLAIRYQTEKPKQGIYFTGPDEFHPKKRYQAWTQGQDELSRYWFPTLDYPNQKATSEVIATVPSGFYAVSNGALLSKAEVPNGVRFHYRLGLAHVTYLITLVVGEFSLLEEVGPQGLPIQYFVQPGREEDGKRAFGNTAKMIEAFEKKIGVEYPYEKYAQVAVQDFIYGGMENTSATTQTDQTLHDARAHLDFSSDPLVSHELAHQWFGDLVTCRDWSHGWLNEGFATFMERVWVEMTPEMDSTRAKEEAKYYAYIDLKDYLDEDSRHYRRPIVCNTYLKPSDLFDRHLYQKGGLVLSLIRAVLGEEPFWRSIKHYVQRHRGQNVETLDLIRAIEETTGRNLRRLFDQWVFGAGHPEFEVSYTWHEEKKLAELTIEQKQTGGQPFVMKDGFTTHLFHVPAVIELVLNNGKKITQKIELREVRERIFLEASEKPVMVRFDPEFTIPKTLKFPRPKEMLLYQLENDQDCMGRIEAAQELVKIADLEVIGALGKALLKETFWGVQAELAAALSEIKTDQAQDALLKALTGGEGVSHPKARRAVVKALGEFKDEKSVHALRSFAQEDPSYYVEGEATLAIATALSGVPALLDSGEQLLCKQLEKPSYLEVIRAHALKGLGLLPGIGRGERTKAMNLLIEYTSRKYPLNARVAALSSLGTVAKGAVPAERNRILEVFSSLSVEPNFKIRMNLILAIESSEMLEALPILARIRTMDAESRIRRQAAVSADVLQLAGSTPESVSSLKTSLDKLEEEYRKLRSRFELSTGLSRTGCDG